MLNFYRWREGRSGEREKEFFCILLIFFKDFIYFYIEGKKGRKRGRKTSVYGCLSHTPQPGTWPTTQACTLIGNQTRDPLVCRPTLSPLSHTSQDFYLCVCVCVCWLLISTFIFLFIPSFGSTKSIFYCSTFKI